MKPQSIGRAFGIGLRIAVRGVSQKLSAPAKPRASAAAPAPLARQAGQLTRGIARSAGGFLRPLHRFGSVLFLEVTGSLYLLFALFFLSSLWQLRPAHPHGSYRLGFLAAAALAVVFLYLSLSAFVRAWRK